MTVMHCEKNNHLSVLVICSVGDLGLITGLGTSPGEGKGYPLQYSGLEVPGLCSPWGCKESDTAKRLLLLL